MRTNEERKKLIYARTEELRERNYSKKRKRTMFCMGGGGLAVSLCLLLSLCKAVRETVVSLSGNILPSLPGTASLFGNSESLAYVVIAILAFLLGACFTLLLCALRKKLENTQQSDSYAAALKCREDDDKYKYNCNYDYDYDEKDCGINTDEGKRE